MEIAYIDRKLQQKCIEKVYGKKILSILYGDGLLNKMLAPFLLPLCAKVPWVSHWYGILQKKASSAKKIIPFIETFGIDASEFETTEFGSFNEFFIRKLKKEKRPIAPGERVLALPADGRYLVYPEFKKFHIKGKTFSLGEFLQDEILTEKFQDGSMAIARLCPIDYHRFHFPCDGMASKAKLIHGPLYSVNPWALKKRIEILCENKRVITEIESSHFGRVLFVEIGATSVGSIKQTSKEGPVKKGDEKGYFEFGGSCIVLLFEKGKVVFDRDLIENTENGCETKANYGESMGCAPV